MVYGKAGSALGGSKSFGVVWFWSPFRRKEKFRVPSKLPAANSRSGSTEGHGANGNLFAAGVLSVVCGFSSKLDVKIMVAEEKDCAKDVKLRNHFVSNRFSSFW